MPLRMAAVWFGATTMTRVPSADTGDPRVIPFHLDRMNMNDLEEVAEIERDAYSLPWPSSAYRRELRENKMAYYLVLRRRLPGVKVEEPPPRRPFPFSLLPQPPRSTPAAHRPAVVGHGGLWIMLDEAHITTIAVRSAYRGQGLGELVLCGLIDRAQEMHSKWVTLEVRVSNNVAQQLYRKYGFRQAGIRPRYYSDNREDAYVMWTEDIQTAEYKKKYAELKQALQEKIAERVSSSIIVPTTALE